MSATCKGCQKPIVWTKTEEGKPVPLDPAAPVYRISPAGLAVLIDRKARELPGGAMVSHFSTCSKAGDFGASRGIVEGVKLCQRDRLTVCFSDAGVTVSTAAGAVVSTAANFDDAVAHYVLAKINGAPPA